MNESLEERTEKEARFDPKAGDVLESGGAKRTVVKRGIAKTVTFEREKDGHRLRGTKSITCWHRWARGATVVRIAP